MPPNQKRLPKKTLAFPRGGEQQAMIDLARLTVRVEEIAELAISPETTTALQREPFVQELRKLFNAAGVIL